MKRLNLGEGNKQVQQYAIHYEPVIAEDNYTLKRKIISSTPEYIFTYQTYNEGIIDLDYHYFYAYLQSEFSEYDAWFNVKDNMLVFGVATRKRESTRNHYASFVHYMEQQHNLKIIKQIKEDCWLMPHIRPGCQIDYAKGRIFFAGEIAGWLNPMGEGISCGMESAFLLVQAMVENYDNPALIETVYREKSSSLHEYMKRQWSFTGSLAETFSKML